MKQTRHVAGLVLLVLSIAAAAPDKSDLRSQAADALKRAATFYHSKAASHGGYVYYYSLDLQDRWGEGRASPDILFVQPPGTPAVGMAFLAAYHATGDRFYLDAAKDAAECLVYGQLQSGGWTQTIQYAPGKRVGKYRNGKGGSWNASSLDDDQTQSALEFLALIDQALAFKHAGIHDASVYGFDALLKAQFIDGAFPQIWIGPVPNEPSTKAKFPDYDWKTEGRVKNYWDYYTLNDNVAGNVARALIAAHQVYKGEKYKTALAKLGEFLIAAQMPDPQPGWAQQYNFQMMPIWARKFEPPAITGWEAQDVMRTLIRIGQYTGDKKYLDPIPRALAYYKKCLLPDGQIARYYELRTNKPLYMDERYQLTYDDSAAPKHYGWKQAARFDEIEKEYEAAKAGNAAAVTSAKAPPGKAEIQRIIADLDSQGRWISTYAGERLVGQPKFAEGFKYISSEVFNKNVEALRRYLAEK